MNIDATFWVAVSFLIFVGLIFYLKVPQKIGQSLDESIKKIKEELEKKNGSISGFTSVFLTTTFLFSTKSYTDFST